MVSVTRKQMIEALTHYELRLLIDNPDNLSEITEFFSNGGFDIYTDKSLKDQYKRKCLTEEA